MFDNIVANNEINFNELEKKSINLFVIQDAIYLKRLQKSMMKSYKMKEIRKILDIEDLKQIQ